MIDFRRKTGNRNMLLKSVYGKRRYKRPPFNVNIRKYQDINTSRFKTNVRTYVKTLSGCSSRFTRPSVSLRKEK